PEGLRLGDTVADLLATYGSGLTVGYLIGERSFYELLDPVALTRLCFYVVGEPGEGPEPDPSWEIYAIGSPSVYVPGYGCRYL
ncbi:MAG: hypothetical protein GWN79_11885, partial [Actinobacteria bacterium]|nr:hypothetical protein [Actinomycetota bacterium]NIS32109.1 hypothetical protein [Actinomycetota bacterium]NIU19743.1 hypothetical protein [Actinomycetota bacterium]NIU67180.1 hypothetical protein [Actinomycetota bacterium]NIV87699.1 hypothetical protein [Actinomycetota bacterium]